MNIVNYKQDMEIPIIADIDICVCGGGPGGIGAAVCAARQGKSVLLVERYGAVGGMAFFGEVTPFSHNHVNNQSLDRPIYKEWVDAVKRYPSGDNSLVDENFCDFVIPKVAGMLAAEDLLLESNCKILYHHNIIDVVMKDNFIEYIIVSSKSGLSAIKAKIFIDSTGDGDVADKAHCPTELGNEDGFCQPMTTCFKLANVNKDIMLTRKEMSELYRVAQIKNNYINPRENILFFPTTQKDIIHFNTTRIIKKSAIDGMELSEAEIIGRQQVREMVKFLRSNVRGFENATIYSIAHHIGVRESRRVIGCHYLTVKDFENQTKFEDAIVKVNYPIDIHSPNGGGTIMKHLKTSEWYEIPYGCIVPLNCDNLLIGSRCISVDHIIHSSCRVMPPVVSIGQAAGMAACMSIDYKVVPQKIDGKELKDNLQKFGAFL